MRTTIPSFLPFSLLVSSAIAATACGPAPHGSGDGGGGSGGSGGTGTGGQPAQAELLGTVVELTAPEIDAIGVPSIAANTDRWAVQWIDRDGGYPEGGVTLVGEGGDVIVPVAKLGLAERAVLRSAGKPSSFGAVTTTTAQPTYNSAFSFDSVGPAGGVVSEGLTDYDYDTYAFDLAPIGDEWEMGVCNQVGAVYRLFATRFGEDVPQSPFSPIAIDPVATAGGVECDEVRLASTGQAVWAVFSGRVDGEQEKGAVFLQRLDPPSELIRVTEPGVESGNPHLLIHGNEMIVEHWHAASSRRAIRRYDLTGQPLAEAVELQSDQDMGDDCDAAMVGDHVVIGWLSGAAVVQSFGLDGAAATGELKLGPSPGPDARRLAVAGLGAVAGVAYVGVDENFRYRIYFGRVGGL